MFAGGMIAVKARYQQILADPQFIVVVGPATFAISMSTRTASGSQIFRFTATVERFDGKGGWYYLEFPYDVKELFGTRAAIRMKGRLNNVEIDRALMPMKSGYHMIALSTALRKLMKVRLGDRVKVEIWKNEDPDRLDMPEELVETLEFMPELKQAWEKITIGKRRGICHWINSGHAIETRAKRVAEVLKRYEEGHEWFKPAR
jgi:hypothetical protein